MQLDSWRRPPGKLDGLLNTKILAALGPQGAHLAEQLVGEALISTLMQWGPHSCRT